jgi:hypothetical protein
VVLAAPGVSAPTNGVPVMVTSATVANNPSNSTAKITVRPSAGQGSEQNDLVVT